MLYSVVVVHATLVFYCIMLFSLMTLSYLFYTLSYEYKKNEQVCTFVCNYNKLKRP